ncbi:MULTISPECIES: hypothetical protein [Paenibacillus]|uniref:hypothetical protein n=1 Tax=Paenibacillus TaxID=44249 RepID=UPI00096CCD93|nr:hypothetical protein [Paenibacillus odorifer]OMD87525.1 hypothetical protein BSK53_00530 [Paenibacillus odorifer]
MYDYQKPFIGVYEYFEKNRSSDFLTAIPIIEDPIEGIKTRVLKIKTDGAELITHDGLNTDISLPQAAFRNVIDIFSQSNMQGYGAIPIFALDPSMYNQYIQFKCTVQMLQAEDLVGNVNSPDIENPLSWHRAVDVYAREKGFVGEIPVLINEGKISVYLFSSDQAEPDIFNNYEINHYTNITYNVTDDQKNRLIQAHELILSKSSTCNSLPEILLAVKGVYGQTQFNYHDINDNCPCGTENVLGCALIGGHDIWINFQDNISVEMLAETVIHEQMHIYGYDHSAQPPTEEDLSDPYYSSIPALAEICIRGESGLGTYIR